MNSKEKYFVICGNRNEFNKFIVKKTDELWNQGNTDITMSHFVYVSGVDTIRGYSNPSGFFIGTWYMRDDIRDILAVLLASCIGDSEKVVKIGSMYNRLAEIESMENLYK